MTSGPPCPRVDRHAHLEGSLDPLWVRERAVEKGLALPAALEALWRGDAVPFQGFIEAFIFSCRFLRTREAARDAIRAAVRRLPQEPGGPRGLDLWVSPHLLVQQAKLISLDALWQGMDDGIREASLEGVRIAAVIDAVNHFGPDHGHEVLDLVLGDRPEWVVGFSTGGLEGVPFRDWAPVFHRARQAGLRLAAHAGENGPGSNVRDAVLEAGVERIVHGVRADDATLALLAERGIPVDVCISSNRALVPDLSLDPREPLRSRGGAHPLPRFLAAGVRCALGTDDPGLIPATLPGEWELAQSLGLGQGDLDQLARYALEDAWCLGRPLGNGA